MVVLSLQMILPASWLQDMVQVPILVAHYFHHNQSEDHIHFTEFIALHYSETKDHHQGDQHHNLPFKHHDLNLEQNTISIAVIDPAFNISAVEFKKDSKVKIIATQHFYSSLSHSVIWRPPKFAGLYPI